MKWPMKLSKNAQAKSFGGGIIDSFVVVVVVVEFILGHSNFFLIAFQHLKNVFN